MSSLCKTGAEAETARINQNGLLTYQFIQIATIFEYSSYGIVGLSLRIVSVGRVDRHVGTE
jgi:hypothetical protein